MSDLISREKVIDVLKETSIIQDNDLGYLVVDEINRIPTAYDVEAVVEKIEKRYCGEMCYGKEHPEACEDCKDVLEMVIDIVRSGGKE